jgi:hypothetical protein
MSKQTMMMTTLPQSRAAGSRLAPLAARALGAASRLLDRLAARLAAESARPRTAEAAQVLEFYAGASAPEGALYLNGELVATLPGVMRL